MVKTRKMATYTSVANNIGYQAGSSSNLTDFEVEEVTSETSKSALRGRLKLEMANCLLDYNLQPLLHVLECIKHSSSFDFRSVKQEFLPAPPATQAMMKITFLNGKQAIKVVFLRNNRTVLTAKSKKKSKKALKLIDVITYLEEIYVEL